MAHMTKYMDNNLEEKVKTSWDNSVRELSGSWNDDDALDEDIKSYKTVDAKREEL